MMRRILIATVAAVLMSAAPAEAVLVYQGAQGNSADGPIIAAKNDGTDARVVGHGRGPRVSPSGRRVAYVDGAKLVVVGNRGRHRHVVARSVYDAGPAVPLAWSHDERHIVAARLAGGAWLVDVPHRTKTRIGPNDEFSGASFAPDDTMLAVARSTPSDAPLTAIELPSLQRHALGEGGAPVWGRHGLAYASPGGLKLRKHIDERPETLLRRTSFPLDWSADGKRLLAYEDSRLASQALLIDLGPRHLKRLKQHILPAQLSRDGTEVLAQTGRGFSQAYGNIVARRPNGALRLLAVNGRRPSWTK